MDNLPDLSGLHTPEPIDLRVKYTKYTETIAFCGGFDLFMYEMIPFEILQDIISEISESLKLPFDTKAVIENKESTVFAEGVEDTEYFRITNLLDIVYTIEDGYNEEGDLESYCYDIWLNTAKQEHHDLFKQAFASLSQHTDNVQTKQTEPTVKAENKYLEMGIHPEGGYAFEAHEMDMKYKITSDYFNLFDPNKNKTDLKAVTESYLKRTDKYSRLLLINGKRGYGKTSLVKHLMKQDTNKLFIFVPNIFVSTPPSIDEVYNHFKREGFMGSENVVLVFENTEMLFSDGFVLEYFYEKFFSSHSTASDKCKIIITYKTNVNNAQDKFNLNIKPEFNLIMNEITQVSSKKILTNELKVNKIKLTTEQKADIVSKLEQIPPVTTGFLSKSTISYNLSMVLKTINENLPVIETETESETEIKNE